MIPGQVPGWETFNSRDAVMTDETLSMEIDNVVASCNGDLRGALKALLLINEQLERELQLRRAAVAQLSPRACATGTMH